MSELNFNVLGNTANFQKETQQSCCSGCSSSAVLAYKNLQIRLFISPFE